MRNFEFTWYEKNDRLKMERYNKVQAAVVDTAEIGTAAKLATDIFCRTFGNLKKNEIVSIQEIDKNGNPIGEPIVPMEGSSIIPIAK